MIIAVTLLNMAECGLISCDKRLERTCVWFIAKSTAELEQRGQHSYLHRIPFHVHRVAVDTQLARCSIFETLAK